MTRAQFTQVEALGWLGILAKLALAIMKGIIGWLANSKALIADAMFTTANVVRSIVERAPQPKHGIGNDSSQPLARIIASALLMFLGFEVAKTSFESIFIHQNELKPLHGFVLIVLIGAIAAKVVLVQSWWRPAWRWRKDALFNNALDRREELVVSSVALLGVGAAWLGNVWNIHWLYYADPIAGLIVALCMIWIGIRWIRDCTHHTFDRALPADERAALVRVVQDVKGVITVAVLNAREHGHYVVVDINIHVNPSISVTEGHEIGKAVKYELMQRFSHVSDVSIHVIPYNHGFPYRHTTDLNKHEAPAMVH
jgi:cation diffusion facilitator family transporter